MCIEQVIKMVEKETLIIGAGLALGLLMLSKKVSPAPPPPPDDIVSAGVTCE